MTADAELDLLPAGEIQGHFHIPAYQRGYRWGEIEVRQLLDDIWDHCNESYYLQPVVVKERNGGWELIDGQQRLTTLYLLQRYMKDEGLQGTAAHFTLEYETRPGSAAYLENVEPELRDENIDFAHIHAAHQCIAEWFDERGITRQRDANKIYDALYDHIFVIWYVVREEENAVDLFTRLNVGRIPLTDAELVKANLLTQVAKTLPPHRAYEVAAQWDSIERDLQKPELWAFLTGDPGVDATHISLLLDTLAPPWRGAGRPRHHTFENTRKTIENDAESFWDRVVELHSRVVGWFEDRQLFHRIGYLTANGRGFRALSDLADDKTRSDFVSTLDEEIRGDLSLDEYALRELTYDDHRTASKALLLMNVVSVMEQPHSSERYSFAAHASRSWTLEHIHAQNPVEILSIDWWKTWLTLHRDALGHYSDISDEERTALLSEIDAALDNRSLNHAAFLRIQQRVTESMSEDSQYEVVHSIANLALLDSGVNSAVGNSLFTVKRAMILDRDRRGEYIPSCTRNVFLKYYSAGLDDSPQLWTAQDRRRYLDSIVDILAPYLREPSEQS